MNNVLLNNVISTFLSALLASSGSLSILKSLDREEQDSYNLTIVAEDHGTPQHSTTQVLSVQVIDVNDEAPWFELSEYEVQIKENQPTGATLLTVSATDRDQGERISFSICNFLADFLYLYYAVYGYFMQPFFETPNDRKSDSLLIYRFSFKMHYVLL